MIDASRYLRYIGCCTENYCYQHCVGVLRRPIIVCICACLPAAPIPVSTQVVILQHPNEVGGKHKSGNIDGTISLLSLFSNSEGSLPSNSSDTAGVFT